MLVLPGNLINQRMKAFHFLFALVQAARNNGLYYDTGTLHLRAGPVELKKLFHRAGEFSRYFVLVALAFPIDNLPILYKRMAISNFNSSAVIWAAFKSLSSIISAISIPFLDIGSNPLIYPADLESMPRFFRGPLSICTAISTDLTHHPLFKSYINGFSVLNSSISP